MASVLMRVPQAAAAQEKSLRAAKRCKRRVCWRHQRAGLAVPPPRCQRRRALHSARSGKRWQQTPALRWRLSISALRKRTLLQRHAW